MSKNVQKKSYLSRILSSINFLVSPELNTEDRRSVPRIPCNLETSFVGENRQTGQTTIHNISCQGFCVETDSRLAVSETIAVNPPRGESESLPPLMARVIWVEEASGGSRAGLALASGLEEEQTWLDETLSSLGYTYDGSQRRKHIRAAAAIDGALTLDEADETHKVSVLNLGMGGALVKSEQTFEKNSQFTLKVGPYEDLPEIKLSGTILRLIEKEEFTLHPSRFRPLDERDEELLREYILNLLGTD